MASYEKVGVKLNKMEIIRTIQRIYSFIHKYHDNFITEYSVN